MKGGSNLKSIFNLIITTYLDGLIHQKVYPEIPANVAYSLTAFGETLKPIMLQMHQLGI
ncbi:MAG: winged helix-turn-helix transcriptional regulator [Microcystis aeruginosa L211-07]|nr:winged helix-turn-helix transcriptional regulator [Microcystis aeruginosa L211-07]